MLILASASPHRKKLLKQAGLKFKVKTSQIDESKISESKPSKLVMKLAELKAKKVAEKERGIILGADTLIFLGGEIMGKPQGKTRKEKFARAKLNLKKLSGRTHEIYTGICLIDTKNGKIYRDYVKTMVTFRKLSPREINDYVKQEPGIITVAGYTNTAHGIFFSKIEGSYSNIIGLPLEKILFFLTLLKDYETYHHC